MTPKQVIEKYFNNKKLTSDELFVMNSLMSGKDAIMAFPGNEEYDVCYQVPGILAQGITLVISISVNGMCDKVKKLNQVGIHAAYINSLLSKEQMVKALKYAAAGRYKFVYVTPDFLVDDYFQIFVAGANVMELVIEDAQYLVDTDSEYFKPYQEILTLLNERRVRPLMAVLVSKTYEDIIANISNVLALHEVFEKKTPENNPKAFQSIDMTDAAKWVINCVCELKGYHGDRMIESILKGKKGAKIDRIRANQFKSYGKLSSYNEEDIRLVISTMYNQGYLKREYKDSLMTILGPNAMTLKDNYNRFIINKLVETGSNVEISGSKTSRWKKKSAFYLTESDAESIEYTEYRYVSELVAVINDANTSQNMKKLTSTPINLFLAEKGLIEEVQGENRRQKMPTEKGLEMGIRVIKRESSIGQYCVLQYPESVQRMVVDYLSSREYVKSVLLAGDN